MDGEDKDGKANCFGSRPVSPSLMHGSIRSHSQQSFPSHPNSLNSDDERDHMGSDVEKDQRDEGKFFLLIIWLLRCTKYNAIKVSNIHFILPKGYDAAHLEF